MKEMNYNYHTHTALCGHATGEIIEYIQNAIEGGIIHMGFSDHAPYAFADDKAQGQRMTSTEARDYVAVIRRLRELYKNKIDIKIGFEMEYYPDKFSEILAFVKSIGAEYLILGQHYMRGIFTGGFHVINGKATDDDLRNYVKDVITAMETGVFTYVAHPDMINYQGDEDLYEREMRRLCIASKRTNIPLEINGQGLRENRIYPAERFWKIAGEVGCPVTIGFDAHSADAAADKTSAERAMTLIGKYNLNYIGKPVLIPIN